MTDRLGEKLSAIELQYDVLMVVREEVGFSDGFAEQLAEALTRGLQRRLGGREIYIPAEDKRDRDMRIRQEFNGRNCDEIMKRYDISKSRIYQIISVK